MSDLSVRAQAEDLRRNARRGAFELPPGELSDVERALFASAALVGAMEEVLRIVVDHTATREQFGAPLRSFQAVQALIARVAADTLVSSAALEHALAVPPAAGPVLAAKVQASFAAGRVAAAAHQAVGAIGYTSEHELGGLTRLLLRLRDAHGEEFASARELSALVVGDGELWSSTVDVLDWDGARAAEPSAAT